MSAILVDRIFSCDHVWLLSEQEGEFILGISEFAQQQLGDIVFVDLPSVGDNTIEKNSCLVVESVKSASDVISPISGIITAVNERLVDSPELINESPYQEGWIIRIKGDSDAAIEGKMSEDEYNQFLETSDK